MWIHARPEGSEISRYDTYKQVEKATGRTPAELKHRPVLRPILHSTLDAFNQFPEMSYQEIQAFIELTGQHLEWWEVKAMMQLNTYRGDTSWQPKQQR